MIVRKIDDSELKRTSELFSIAFEFGSHGDKTNEEMLEDIKKNPNSRHSKYYKEGFAAFSDKNEMMSYIGAMPYNVNFDGHVTKMSGIGGVSTLPHFRKSGGVRGCFETALPYLYDNDFEFSYLYPFSTYYYEKFGYGICGEKIGYSINLRALANFPEATGSIDLHENDKYLDDIKSVYKAFTKKYNMTVDREEFDFMEFTNSNPAKSESYTYVYHDVTGKPCGVMTFNKSKDKGNFHMNCGNFWFINMEGFKGLLNLTSAFSTYYENINFTLPSDINITSYIKEWAIYPCSKNYFNMGMARVINVKKVLSLAKYSGTGELTIAIDDKQILQNNKTFQVLFANGVCTDVLVVDGSPDISLSINDFSRMILGDRDVSELQYMDKVLVNCDLEKVAKVFYKKPLYICNGF